MTLDVAGKRVVVIGLGLSGVAACKLLVAKGAHVVGNDLRVDLPAIEGVEMVLGHHDFGEADLVVISPGVPPFPALAKYPVWGEVELATRALAHPARLIAIGGTNGKSTVTSLVGALLEAHGLRTFVGGNLGEPLAAHTEEKWDVVVLEVSSFQMERVDAFHPEVAVLLNVTPDHLDRYPDFAAYAQAKGNAFVRQTPNDVAVVPAGDDTCIAQAKRGLGRLVTFGPSGELAVTATHVGPFERAKTKLAGGHNALNVAAALAAVQPFAIPHETIAKVLATFEGLAHRMALVAEHDGIRFYDDSKGTNVGASVTAVRGITEPKVVLIAGGRDKGGSYEPLVEALRERGRGVVLIGEAADMIGEAIGDAIPWKKAVSMAEAVMQARALAEPGDAVLLSPACSSFDMFKDYKHRGDAFVSAVEKVVKSR